MLPGEQLWGLGWGMGGSRQGAASSCTHASKKAERSQLSQMTESAGDDHSSSNQCSSTHPQRQAPDSLPAFLQGRPALSAEEPERRTRGHPGQVAVWAALKGVGLVLLALAAPMSVKCGCRRLCKAVCGCALLREAVCGCVWLCVTTCGSV
jgi:hypothetical protein